MRPLKLTVEGFTAFRTEQVLDMESLDLFAIVGPTGAGKSSLLDAMTYALYGQVARIDGSQTTVKELVSQGLPWMKVMLDFQVGPERYRVTRRTPASGGAAKALLERVVDGTPQQFGPGADRIKDVKEAIGHLVGLDYDGFTRSVLLPQGKFADLITGKAEQRRRLLIDLLDLTLFARMGERARRIAQDAEGEADRDGASIQELAHATPRAARAAKAALKVAEERESRLAGAADRVEGLASRATAVADEIRQAMHLAQEAERLSGTARSVQAGLRALAERAAAAEVAMAALQAAERKAREESEGAAAALQEAEHTFGPRDALVAGLVTAERLPRADADLQEQASALSMLSEGAPGLERAVAEADRAVGVAEAVLATAETALARDLDGLEAVRHADLVADLTANVEPGDPCPVCGSQLAEIPVRPGAPALAEAKAAAADAERARDRAREGLEVARRAADGARHGVDERVRAVAHAEQQVARSTEGLEELRAQVAAAVGDPAPADPVVELRSRIASFDAAAQRCRAAEASAAEAAGAVAEAREELAAVRAESGLLAGRLDLDLAGLTPDPPLEGLPFAPLVPAVPRAEDVPALIAHAGAVTEVLDGFATAARQGAAVRDRAADALRVEAIAAVDGLVPPADRFEDLRRALAAAALDARQQRSEAAATVAALKVALDKRKALEARVRTLTARRRVFHALSNALRADRIIDFLQGEALRILCVAGSEHLEALSGGRYRLAYLDDEFVVIDAENGDERRSVRTLSGGETFLASLGLALALAGQVRSLAVTERAALESLFLDEGFGTLDPETLETVAGAIEQLGGDGRLVGIVTHVKELADRVPTRIQVSRSPTGHGSVLAGGA